MVHIMMGPEGSGKTKLLLQAISSALTTSSGSMVCIEKGQALRYDLDHRVRLIDAGEYSIDSYELLRGFLCGLCAGNFDISHIFIDNLYKMSRLKDSNPLDIERFLDWCSVFSAENGINFTFTIPGDTADAPDYIARYLG